MMIRKTVYIILLVLACCLPRSATAQNFQEESWAEDIVRADDLLREADYAKALEHVELAIEGLEHGSDSQALAEAYWMKAALVTFAMGETEQVVSLMSQAIMANPCGERNVPDYMNDPRIMSLKSAAEHEAKWFFDATMARAIAFLSSNQPQEAKASLQPILCYSENPVIAQINEWIESGLGDGLTPDPVKRNDSSLDQQVKTDPQSAVVVTEKNLPENASGSQELNEVWLGKKKRIGLLSFHMNGIDWSSRQFLPYGMYDVEIVDGVDNERFMRNYDIVDWSDFVVRKGQVTAKTVLDLFKGKFAVGELKQKHTDAMRYIMASGDFDYIVAVKLDNASGFKSGAVVSASLYNRGDPGIPMNYATRRIKGSNDAGVFLEEIMVEWLKP